MVRCMVHVTKHQQGWLSFAAQKILTIKTWARSNRRLQLRVVQLETEVHPIKVNFKETNSAQARFPFCDCRGNGLLCLRLYCASSGEA